METAGSALAPPLAELEVRLSSLPPVAPVETGIRQAAVAAVLHPSPEPQLLFIRRAEDPADPWSGHMAFPGGRVDPEDHDALAAARRETREELGFDPGRRGTLLGRLSRVPVIARGRRMPLVIEPFVFALNALPELTPNQEVDEALWIPLSHLAAAEHRSTFLWQREDLRVVLPYCDFQGHRVWGLTLRMVDELLGLFPGNGHR